MKSEARRMRDIYRDNKKMTEGIVADYALNKIDEERAMDWLGIENDDDRIIAKKLLKIIENEYETKEVDIHKMLTSYDDDNNKYIERAMRAIIALVDKGGTWV